MEAGEILLLNRQKMIKLADRSKLGWSVVEEYEVDELAEGIMVSDFVEASMGFLNFLDDSGKKTIARVLLEYGGNREGYWTLESFCKKWTMLLLLPSPNILELRLFGYLTTCSSCHNAYADDALIATHMNASQEENSTA